MPSLESLVQRVRGEAAPVAQVWSVPGRVNLMGDHTDYNDGYCLPMAIDRWCVVACAPHRERSSVRARSLDVDGDVVVPADGSAEPSTLEPAWGRFVAGAVRVLADSGARLSGADLVVASTVPIGSGLSSSSALAVALTLALHDHAGALAGAEELARRALAAEVAATGVPGGLMDQLTALNGQAGAALLIDCRSLTIDPIPLPRDVAVLVVHSGLPRVLAGSEYGARRRECEAIAARLGLRALRDASPEDVVGEPRARHVVAENARVLETAAALRAGDVNALRPLLLASHTSLRDDYGVSTPELDALVETMVDAGAMGARLTGAGFGGCVVGFVPRHHADDVAAKTVTRYTARTGRRPAAFVARAVAGARRER